MIIRVLAFFAHYQLSSDAVSLEGFDAILPMLIIADENSNMHYIEGCTAPVYSSDSLHAAVVEVIAKKGARVR